MPEQFTEICEIGGYKINLVQMAQGNVVNSTSTFSTSTRSCYRPLDVYTSVGIEFLFFMSIIFVGLYSMKK